MRIGIHAVATTLRNPTGVENYVRELIRAILLHPDALLHRFFLYTNQAFPDGVSLLPNAEARILRFPFGWTQLRLSWEMLQSSPDVLFVPTHSLPRVLPRRRFVTIHGLEFEHYPHLYSKKDLLRLRLVTRDAVRRATGLLTLSQAVKDDLIQLYGVSANTIVVIPPGPPSVPNIAREGMKSHFLFVGRLETKKNVDGLIRAYTRFTERIKSNPPELILAGRPGFGYDKIEKAIAESSAREHIRVLGYISDEQKWQLLHDALAFVFPSWAEGFGFPILEAQAAGVPVVTGTTSSIPEVAGEGALLTDINDEALAEALWSVYDSESVRRDLVQKGEHNLLRFSWERAAQQTLKALTS